MLKSGAFVLLVGESTKHLHKYVGWEIDLALDLSQPLIVANLNKKAKMDNERYPAKLRDVCAVHIPFKLAAIRHALDNSRVRASLRNRHQGPLYHGIQERGGTIFLQQPQRIGVQPLFPFVIDVHF